MAESLLKIFYSFTLPLPSVRMRHVCVELTCMKSSGTWKIFLNRLVKPNFSRLLESQEMYTLFVDHLLDSTFLIPYSYKRRIQLLYHFLSLWNAHFLYYFFIK